ncbi:hypothetical protein HDG42_000655 [Paraburkholderia sp. JPY171]|uniref:hypothetical protein n=1 Tax=Paraburkholderia atlantica TaxID=2654982 RepID=UPI00160E5828|nr:hypothetical protein [Paraburkholderia atlantica]MBB5414631.1 hypothetical protein [Paraburkholderia atlantica]
MDETALVASDAHCHSVRKPHRYRYGAVHHCPRRTAMHYPFFVDRKVAREHAALDAERLDRAQHVRANAVDSVFAPNDKPFSSYDAVFNAFKAITKDFSARGQRALFHDNAERVYRL